MVQVGMKDSAKTGVFRSISNTATKKDYLIRKKHRLWKINKKC